MVHEIQQETLQQSRSSRFKFLQLDNFLIHFFTISQLVLILFQNQI